MISLKSRLSLKSPSGKSIPKVQWSLGIWSVMDLNEKLQRLWVNRDEAIKGLEYLREKLWNILPSKQPRISEFVEENLE